MVNQNPEDINNNGDHLVESDDIYQTSYDDVIDSTDEISDEWNDDVSEIGSDRKQPQPKKKKSKLTLFYVIVAIVVLLFGSLILLGSGADAPQQPTGSEAVNSVNNTENPAPAAPPTEQQSVQPNTTDVPSQEVKVVEGGESASPSQNQLGIMDDPNIVQQYSDKTNEFSIDLNNAPPQKAPETAEQSPVDTPASAPTPVPAPALENEPVPSGIKPKDFAEVVTPDLKPVSDFPSIESIKKPDVPEVAAPQAAAPEEVKLQNDSDVAQKLSGALERIEELEKNMQSKTDELAEQSKLLSEKSSRIVELEARLAERSENVSVIEKPVVRKNSPKVQVNVQSIERVTPVKPKMSPASQWTLKSATSKKATIYNKSTSDLKTIAVGETVDGLGRILNISEKNSRWVVTGTKASISE